MPVHHDRVGLAEGGTVRISGAAAGVSLVGQGTPEGDVRAAVGDLAGHRIELPDLVDGGWIGLGRHVVSVHEQIGC